MAKSEVKQAETNDLLNQYDVITDEIAKLETSSVEVQVFTNKLKELKKIEDELKDRIKNKEKIESTPKGWIFRQSINYAFDLDAVKKILGAQAKPYIKEEIDGKKLEEDIEMGIISPDVRQAKTVEKLTIKIGKEKKSSFTV